MMSKWLSDILFMLPGTGSGCTRRLSIVRPSIGSVSGRRMRYWRWPTSIWRTSRWPMTRRYVLSRDLISPPISFLLAILVVDTQFLRLSRLFWLISQEFLPIFLWKILAHFFAHLSTFYRFFEFFLIFRNISLIYLMFLLIFLSISLWFQEKMKPSLAKMFSLMQKSVMSTSRKMFLEMKRHNYVTPTNYLELVAGYKKWVLKS